MTRKVTPETVFATRRNPPRKTLREKLSQNRGKIIGAGITLLALAGTAKFIDSKYFLIPDFNQAEKIQYNNPSGELWDAYMGENVPRNRFNWEAYQIEVDKLNPNGREGLIYLPDLDENGKVGEGSNSK